MDIAFVVVVLAIALGTTLLHGRILAKNARTTQERREGGEPEPSTLGKRIAILACAVAVIGLAAVLTR